MTEGIQIFKTPDELSEAAAQFIMGKAHDAIKARGQFVIALSGGNTPTHLYELLSRPPYDKQIWWDKVFVFWGDERCLPLDDKNNNAHNAKKALLDKVNIPAANIYRIPSDLKPEIAAQEYENTIRTFFKSETPSFDLILLGLGEDGHTASLFPHSTALADTKHLITSLYAESQSSYRITMTASLINMAHDILFLVSGAGKAEIIHTIIKGQRHPQQYPAQMINPQRGGLYWYIDKEAAAKL